MSEQLTRTNQEASKGLGFRDQGPANRLRFWVEDFELPVSLVLAVVSDGEFLRSMLRQTFGRDKLGSQETKNSGVQ